MARFVQVPALYIGRSGNWLLSGDLIYDSDIVGRVVVPEGFECDLASLPFWVPDFLIAEDGQHRSAAIVHDWFCRSKQIKRATADRVFLEAMEEAGEKRWRRYAMYWAVRSYTAWLQMRGKA